MILRFGHAMLRDMERGDIERHVRWMTEETAWSDWDAPWEVLPATAPDALRAKLLIQLQRPLADPRVRMELCAADGTHVGRVNAYALRDDRSRLAAGIAIRESAWWGRGIGVDAYALWCGYLLVAHDRPAVCSETWSGNERMIRVATRCGFRETRRRVGIRRVRGRRYDALRFEVTPAELFPRFPGLGEVVRTCRPSPA